MRKGISFYICLVLALSAAASAAGAGGLLTPLPSRLTDGSIKADLTTLEEVQSRLIALNGAGRPINDYFWAKAQAWLDFAYDEYTENDKTGMAEAALIEAIKLIEKMEAGDSAISMDTPILHGIKHREDLWRLCEDLKQSAGFPVVAASVARLEVKLSQYSHEMAELGWRHAKHLLGEIEELAAEASSRAAAYRLRIKLDVDGFGRIVPDPELETYSPGQELVLRAVPGAGWEFASWEGAAAGQGNPAVLSPGRDIAVIAVFRRLSYAVTVGIEGGGRVQLEHEGDLFILGDPLCILAEPNPGWAFDRWEGGLAGQSNPINLYVEGDLSGTAVFRPIDYTIAPRIAGAGSISFNPDNRYHRFGDVVTAKAAPAPGWRFDHWEDAAYGEANPVTLRVDGSRILTAVFHPLPGTIPSVPVSVPQSAPENKPILRLPGSVHFALNRAAIAPKTAKILTELAATLKANPDIAVILVGHADPQGNAAKNLALSEQRVNSVRDYLLNGGVSPEQVRTNYVGDTKRLTNGKSKRDYALERRVEIGYLTVSRTVLVYSQEEDLQL